MATLLDIVKKGSADRSVAIRIIDSTDGTPETGVVYNTSGIDLWYRREGAAKTSITEATLSALTDAHSDGGFLHIGDGEYRLDLPDAAFASGANYVDIGGTVTGMIVIGGRVRLVNYDPEDGTRLGLTALPNAAAEAAGGLYTRGTGAGQINQDANGRIDVNLLKWLGSTPAALSTNGYIQSMLMRWLTDNSGGTPSALRDSLVVADADEFANTNPGAYLQAILYPYFAALVRKDTGFYTDNSAGVIAELNIDFGSGAGSYDPRTDSQEAIRDRGDSAWVTGTALDAAGVRAAVGLASANLDTQLGAIDDYLDTEIAAIKAKTDNLPASPAATGDIPTAATVADAIWDEARSGHTTAGTFGESFDGLEAGQAATGTLSTTQMTTNLTEATDDHYNGRIIVWLTGALKRQATDITDYTGSTKMLTFTAVTEAPANGDRFIIV